MPNELKIKIIERPEERKKKAVKEEEEEGDKGNIK